MADRASRKVCWREGEEMKEREGKERRGREGKGREGESVWLREGREGRGSVEVMRVRMNERKGVKDWCRA